MSCEQDPFTVRSRGKGLASLQPPPPPPKHHLGLALGAFEVNLKHKS